MPPERDNLNRVNRDEPDPYDAQTFFSISNLLHLAARAVHRSPDQYTLRELRTVWLESSLSASVWALRQAGTGDLEVIRPTHDDPIHLLEAARTLFRLVKSHR